MSSKPTVIGSFHGEDVHEVVLKGGGDIEATIITFGAVIRDLQVAAPEGKRRVILGFPTFADYERNAKAYQGAVPGRVANRIAHGTFTLDGAQHEVSRNQAGKHMLHGGEDGFSDRNWTILASSADSVTLGLVSPDGDQGFPGKLEAKVTYTLADSAIKIHWSATTDKPTLVNLTQHSFFNLDGTAAGDTLSHKVLIEADHYLPVDGDSIPTGEIRAVAGTPFDFLKSRPIKLQGENGEPFHYDHNHVIRGFAPGKLSRAVEVTSSHGDLVMEVWTDQPGIQFYDAKPMNIPTPGHDGMRLRSRSGIALEPQVHPDAINHSNFPNSVLRPGEEYNHHSEFRFQRK